MPIICICNDKYSQKLKSLRTHTLELEFRKPDKRAIAKRMMAVAQREGLAMNEQVCAHLSVVGRRKKDAKRKVFFFFSSIYINLFFLAVFDTSIHIPSQAMEALAESCNGDLRAVLGQLQMIRLGATRMSYDQVRSLRNVIDASVRVNIRKR
jgi:DNA polymerase III delta prime subunit